MEDLTRQHKPEQIEPSHGPLRKFLGRVSIFEVGAGAIAGGVLFVAGAPIEIAVGAPVLGVAMAAQAHKK
jgi:hypothetical protein